MVKYPLINQIFNNIQVLLTIQISKDILCLKECVSGFLKKILQKQDILVNVIYIHGVLIFVNNINIKPLKLLIFTITVTIANTSNIALIFVILTLGLVIIWQTNYAIHKYLKVKMKTGMQHLLCFTVVKYLSQKFEHFNLKFNLLQSKIKVYKLKDLFSNLTMNFWSMWCLNNYFQYIKMLLYNFFYLILHAVIFSINFLALSVNIKIALSNVLAESYCKAPNLFFKSKDNKFNGKYYFFICINFM